MKTDRWGNPVIPLVRVRAGFYRTANEKHQIVRGEPGCPWAGLWMWSYTDGRAYGDPVRTFAEARENLNAAVAANRDGF